MEARKVVAAAAEDSHSKRGLRIVKGKRTKRQRPQPRIPLKIPLAWSPKNDDDSSDIIQGNNNNSNFVASTSSGEYCGDLRSTDVEEEDVANCLILLAQGQSHLSPNHRQSAAGDTGYRSTGGKLAETGAAAGEGKVGCYAYECKTCSKTFRSFQALGGHCASHKKHPKIKAEEEEEEEKRRHRSFLLSHGEDFPHVSPSSLLNNTDNKTARVHECSFCGAEFSTGQALGGHMRRHRGVVIGSQTSLSLTPMAIVDDHHHHDRKKTMAPSPPAKNIVLSLDFDLNLPAPEDDPRESETHFASKQPQDPKQPQPPQLLVFSPPALVDCHY
ncbi:hypothetical protein Nepgr_015134 [Nepenthes gracilis]|uniref:C2H2-type domain-containing protein n=1 Tax=Nepenthes gracilis TaxID=150966 RepID=A0AAD3SKQ5_NEPGR|nr:hypothetical protein Nepgr_015134 [Nepenthes gracilis]